MKQCCACGAVKPETEFGKYAKNKDGLQSRCKLCKRAYDADYYKGNDARKQSMLVRNKVNTNKIIQYVKDYLTTHPCVDCGECDTIVLEFDHVRGEKIGNVSELVRVKKSLRLVKAEIEKCEVRCANCHRRVTVARRGGEPI